MYMIKMSNEVKKKKPEIGKYKITQVWKEPKKNSINN